MAHMIRENAGQKLKTISELFINKNFEYTFVLFVSNKSLPHKISTHSAHSDNFYFHSILSNLKYF